MRIPSLLCALAATVGCAGGSASSPARTATEPTHHARQDARPPLGSTAEVLPAGLYFRAGDYADSACEGCAEPRWAVAAGPFDSGEAATDAVEAASLDALPPGYPWAVHTDKLALRDEAPSGILVVLGLFEDERAARAHAERHGARAHPLASREEALARLHARLGDPDWSDREPRVVQVDDGTPAEAFAPSDVAALLERLHMQVHDGLEDYHHERDAATAQLAPLCTVDPGSVHLFVGYEQMVSFQDDFAPVRCPDGKLAYVRWTRTRLLSVVRRAPDGAYRIEQSVLVECDVPHFEEWAYDRDGRTPLPADAPRYVTASAGCGGP